MPRRVTGLVRSDSEPSVRLWRGILVEAVRYSKSKFPFTIPARIAST
jgi:hypothetical protein